MNSITDERKVFIKSVVMAATLVRPPHVPRSRFSFCLALHNKRLVVLTGRLGHLEQQLIRWRLLDDLGRGVYCNRDTQMTAMIRREFSWMAMWWNREWWQRGVCDKTCPLRVGYDFSMLIIFTLASRRELDNCFRRLFVSPFQLKPDSIHYSGGSGN